jgi:hypothetical protein
MPCNAPPPFGREITELEELSVATFSPDYISNVELPLGVLQSIKNK